MNSKTKISLIVISQIALIVGSFLTIAILESQISLVGNSVNIAGKNRLLTSQFLNELGDFMYVKNSNATPEIKLNELEENILLLKNGGVHSGLKIQKLDETFMNEWNVVYQQYGVLKLNYEKFKEGSGDAVLYQFNLSTIENDVSFLINLSDVLAEKIGTAIDKNSQSMIFLQIILLILNVGVHIGLLLIIFKILNKNFKQNMKIQKLVTIGELASKLAHDMRNPLSIIDMSTQLLKSKTTSKDDAEKLDMIEKGIVSLSHQINNVMDFVRVREPELKLWNLNSILEECFDRFKLPSSVKVNLPKKPIQMKCDRFQFETLFINLISNALDSIQNKGSIEVNVKVNHNNTIIEIIDSGIGITDDKIKSIFDPLVTYKNKGTGLGLASCKTIVENHRGTIIAKNNPTTFVITLPNL